MRAGTNLLTNSMPAMMPIYINATEKFTATMIASISGTFAVIIRKGRPGLDVHAQEPQQEGVLAGGQRKAQKRRPVDEQQ